MTSPASSDVCGCQFRTWRARVRSGRRCFGSSSGSGLETISLLRLQEFLWYALPVKWPMSTPGRVGVAKALGRLFLLAGLDRYAGVCSSAGTEKIITAYADRHEEGIAAYTEAIEESNAAPPDTELLAWGSVMGSQERAAYDACAATVGASSSGADIAT